MSDQQQQVSEASRMTASKMIRVHDVLQKEGEERLLARGRIIDNDKADLVDPLQELLRYAVDMSRPSGHCGLCGRRYDAHSDDCPVPQARRALARHSPNGACDDTAG